MASTIPSLEESLRALCAPFVNNDDRKATPAQKLGSECNAADFRLLMTHFGHDSLDDDDFDTVMGEFVASQDDDVASDPQQKCDISSDAMITTSKMLEWLGQQDSTEEGEDKAEQPGQSLDIESALQLLAKPGRSFDYDSMLELLSRQDGETLLRQEEIVDFLDEVKASGNDQFSLDNLASVLKADKVIEQKISTQSTGVQTSPTDGGEAQNDMNVDPQTPRYFSPLYHHPALSGKYTDAIERGAFKKARLEAKSEHSGDVIVTPRGTSPLHHHPYLSGIYTAAIERGAFKKVEVTTKASDSVRCTYFDTYMRTLLLVRSNMSPFLLSLLSGVHACITGTMLDLQ